MAVRLQAY